MDDPFVLARFVEAQDPVFGHAMAELRAGRKRSHWMWFVFPQIAGLGFSSMAQRYAIGSLDEARAYLDHAVLGPRLREATAVVNGLAEPSAHAIFSSPDDMKFRSSMTLFAEADGQEPLFRLALSRFFRGEPDPATLERLDALRANPVRPGGIKG